MSPTVVIFEDHTLRHFRPISWSLPVGELRVGMFNLRERVELAGAEGGLLTRPYLAPLHTCTRWSINPQELPGDDSVLWLNARCRPSVGQLRELFQALPACNSFVQRDDHGPLMAWLQASESRDLLASWHTWANQEAEAENPGVWNALEKSSPGPLEIPALGFLYDVVPATSETLVADALFLTEGPSWRREPFGLFPEENAAEPEWLRESTLRPVQECEEYRDRFASSGGGIYVGEDVRLASSVEIDDSAGPVILDRGVRVMPFCYLEGPLYVGPSSRIKAGSSIYGESSFGIGNRLAGEIGESTFLDFANKQHDGFIGHAVIGSFTNLGAMTTCSDLKNNYGNVRVDLGFGSLDTGLRFVGLMMGDHAKTAIGTLFNTGTCVGFASNIFGGGMPPKHVPGYSWGGQEGAPAYDAQRAMATAEVVLGRRGCRMVSAHKNMMIFLSRF